MEAVGQFITRCLCHSSSSGGALLALLQHGVPPLEGISPSASPAKSLPMGCSCASAAPVWVPSRRVTTPASNPAPPQAPLSLGLLVPAPAEASRGVTASLRHQFALEWSPPQAAGESLDPRGPPWVAGARLPHHAGLLISPLLTPSLVSIPPSC